MTDGTFWIKLLVSRKNLNLWNESEKDLNAHSELMLWRILLNLRDAISLSASGEILEGFEQSCRAEQKRHENELLMC
jgi:hypothetical protein